jgi:hypothetical protein
MMVSDDRQKRIWKARLLVMPPAEVFNEIKTSWAEPHSLFGYDSEELELTLLQRGEPLIDLALAGYGSNPAVIAELYLRSFQHDPLRSPMYMTDLRVACLSNRGVRPGILAKFPADVLGEEETLRIITESDWVEVDALMNNPNLDEQLIEALYRYEGPFAAVSEERWRGLVHSSATNPRLCDDRSNDFGPDLQHHRIHESIVRLLETAPRTKPWLSTLYHLLDHLDPSQVAWPESLELLLDWPREKSSEEGGEATDGGYFTSLPLTEEFRCLVALLYGRSLRDNKTKLLGARDAPDVALRCAYYARGALTEKEMAAGYERDKDVFSLAVTYNDGVLRNERLRKLFEEEYLGGSADRYQKRLRQIQTRQSLKLGEIASEPTSKHQVNYQEEQWIIIRKLERRIGLIGLLVIALASGAAAVFAYRDLPGRWGQEAAGWIAFVTFIGFAIYWGRKFDRD